MSPAVTALKQRLRLSHPIIQAPLAGGGDTPALVAAVCNAGALGFIGAAYLTPQQIVEASARVREMTTRPFGINLFAPTPVPAAVKDAGLALARVAPFYRELGLPEPSLPKATSETFELQLQAALNTGASIFSFTLGIPTRDAVVAIKDRGMMLAATATTVDEAVMLEQVGVEAIVVQGAEAGGHRATFSGDFDAAMVGTISLVPQVVDAVSVPVIASGGIMDGRGIVAALALGAGAVQMGTAFLTCEEAGIPDVYKAAIIGAHENETRLTRAFSGRPARGIVNRFMMEVEREPIAGAILPFPLQNTLTRPLRNAAARQGRAEYLSLWAGQGVRLARRRSAQNLIKHLADEMEMAFQRLAVPSAPEAPLHGTR